MPPEVEEATRRHVATLSDPDLETLLLEGERRFAANAMLRYDLDLLAILQDEWSKREERRVSLEWEENA